MLNEVDKRGPDFVEHDSVRVELADGQQWAFPLPWLVVQPVFENGVAVRSYRRLGYDKTTDILVEMLADLDGPNDGPDAVASVTASLAASLLRMSYDLDEGDLDQLLAFRSDVAGSTDWMVNVVEIATGRHGVKRGTGAIDA